MEAQMTEKRRWILVEHRGFEDETRWVLRDEYDPSMGEIAGREFGYGVRSSAPGYLDCTEWTIYRNLREAERAYRAEIRANKGEDY